jgi:pseudouridine-5'-phosphate glycosidase
MIEISDEVARALAADEAVVALESTVLAHGLPHPRNRDVARALERTVREAGAVPATVAVLAGSPHVGIDAAALDRICGGNGFRKLSTRDLAAAAAQRADGATTVASTMWLSSRAGVRVFATGGIGGVHRGLPRDVSADLVELGRTRQIVVCAGAKAILDLAATREALETLGVLIVGWGTDEMPAFYTRTSGLPVDVRVDSAEEVAGIWRAQQALGTPGAILLCVPPPEACALSAERVERHLAQALRGAEAAGVAGKEVTPFLLAELGRLSDGETLDVNVALLESNARVAAEVAVALGEA